MSADKWVRWDSLDDERAAGADLEVRQEGGYGWSDIMLIDMHGAVMLEVRPADRTPCPLDARTVDELQRMHDDLMAREMYGEAGTLHQVFRSLGIRTWWPEQSTRQQRRRR